jgi:hypothetical protein
MQEVKSDKFESLRSSGFPEMWDMETDGLGVLTFS